jgi:hypothetical protein
MHFPKHWAKAAWRGDELNREAWGWSDVSEDDARRVATERAARFARTGGAPAASDVYGYPDRPLREPVLRTLADGTDGVHAVITRNSHGCDVLNADRAVFIDVDLPDLPRPAKPGFLSALFGKPKPVPAEDPRIAVEAAAIARLETWQRAHPQFSFRVYRTAAGLRYLLTSAPLAPDDPLVASAMDAAGADPEYRRLCGVQKSFRARLTPKPWRCGAPRPPHRFPLSATSESAAMDKWLAAYARSAAGHATCLHLLDLGTAPTHPALGPIVTGHDRLTRAESGLPLA